MKTNTIFNTCITCLMVFFSTSCLKQDFDAPPDNSNHDPGLKVTHTIAQIQQWVQYAVIEQEAIIQGVVVMDDKSGNYYKKIVIQDTSGGIEVLIDQNNLYNDYPVGRKVYIRLKGLQLGAYGQNLQLGYTPDASGNLSPIPFIETSHYIVKANYPNIIIPDTVNLVDLISPTTARSMLNTLVAIREVEFDDAIAGNPYAQQANIASATNLRVNNCYGQSIFLRTSGYAKFQPYPTPLGRGVLVGVYTRYNNTAQITIRDTMDVHFIEKRCDGTEPEPNLLTFLSIDSLRKIYNGTDITLPEIGIRGIVISDRNNGNVASGNIILQGSNQDKGIVLYYGGNPNYALGDSLEIDLTGCKLGIYNGKLQVESVKVAKTKRVATGKKITPQATSIKNVLDNFNNFESTLVSFSQINWGGGNTYNGQAGNLDISDATGTIRHYAAFNTTFKDLPLPAAPVSSITGYIDNFNGIPQIRIRFPDEPVNDVKR